MTSHPALGSLRETVFPRQPERDISRLLSSSRSLVLIGTVAACWRPQLYRRTIGPRPPSAGVATPIRQQRTGSSSFNIRGRCSLALPSSLHLSLTFDTHMRPLSRPVTPASQPFLPRGTGCLLLKMNGVGLNSGGSGMPRATPGASVRRRPGQHFQ